MKSLARLLRTELCLRGVWVSRKLSVLLCLVPRLSVCMAYSVPVQGRAVTFPCKTSDLFLPRKIKHGPHPLSGTTQDLRCKA